MSADATDSAAKATESRIDAYLAEVEKRLAIFQDGIENWDVLLPEFSGVPRRWPLDDQHTTTVGDTLLSRYAGFDWWVLEEHLKNGGSLDRAFRRNRMTESQCNRYLRSRKLFARLRPAAIERGLDYDWRRHAIAPRLMERCPNHPSVRYIRIAEQSHPPEPPIRPVADG